MSDAAPDQSMEDVLASIKRVMARDPAPLETPRRAARPIGVPKLDPDDVLELTDEADDGLTSADTLRATRDKLQSLARMERASDDADGARPGQTVEALVREMMKPMLSAWLDEHLPAIVDAAVEREVRRITRG